MTPRELDESVVEERTLTDLVADALHEHISEQSDTPAGDLDLAELATAAVTALAEYTPIAPTAVRATYAVRIDYRIDNLELVAVYVSDAGDAADAVELAARALRGKNPSGVVWRIEAFTPTVTNQTTSGRRS